MSRYKRREVAINDNETFDEHFEVRDVKSIIHFRTPKLMYPTDEQYKALSFVSHVWSRGDRFHLLAAKYYSNSELWWIIAQFNQTPTEQHCKEGQPIRIPYPLVSVYRNLG